MPWALSQPHCTTTDQNLVVKLTRKITPNLIYCADYALITSLARFT